MAAQKLMGIKVGTEVGELKEGEGKRSGERQRALLQLDGWVYEVW